MPPYNRRHGGQQDTADPPPRPVGRVPAPPPPPLGVCVWMHPVNGTGYRTSSLGRPTPGVVKQDKSSGGSVDTTKTRSDPQRVRMSSGERPIGAAKGKQTNTMAPPPPLQSLVEGSRVRKRCASTRQWYHRRLSARKTVDTQPGPQSPPPPEDSGW